MLGSGLGKIGDSGRHSMVSKKLNVKSQFLSITSAKGSRCVFLDGQSKDNDGIQLGVQERSTTREVCRLVAGVKDGWDSGRRKKLPGWGRRSEEDGSLYYFLRLGHTG